MKYELCVTNLKDVDKNLTLKTNDMAFAKKVFFDLSKNLMKAGFSLEYPYLQENYLLIAKCETKSVVAKLTIEK